MGWFNKRQEEPVPEPALQPKPKPKPVADAKPKVVAEPKVKVAAASTATPSPEPASQARPQPVSKAQSMTANSDFGIQNAMELMRKLPQDNPALVVQVVKTTLETLQIDVESIIADAKEKREKISARISGLKSEIQEFEEEIAARREEIKALEDDDAETKTVQERLEMSSEDSRPQTSGSGFDRPRVDTAGLKPPGG